MDLKISNRVALVCASSAGIGKAIANSLATEGVHVSIFGRNADKLESTRAEISRTAKGKVLATICDLGIKTDLVNLVKKTQSELGAIDILINNQGGPPPGKFEDLKDDQLKTSIQVNLESVITLLSLCLPEMRARGWGRIINVLSVSGKEPLPNMLLSNILRPAVLGLSKSLAVEYGAFGITVNSVLPYAVATERSVNLMKQTAEREHSAFQAILTRATKSIPVGHIATPEEFAEIVTFLCSPRASYINGSAISVDGGASKSLY